MLAFKFASVLRPAALNHSDDHDTMPETAPISCLERACDLRSFMSSIISKGFTGEGDLALIGPSTTWLRRPSAHLRKAGAKAGSPERTLRTASCSLLLRSTPIVKKMQAQTRPANSGAQVGCWFCERSSNCGSPKRSRPAKTSSASLLTRTRPGSPLLLGLLRFTRTHTHTHTRTKLLVRHSSLSVLFSSLFFSFKGQLILCEHGRQGAKKCNLYGYTEVASSTILLRKVKNYFEPQVFVCF